MRERHLNLSVAGLLAGLLLAFFAAPPAGALEVRSFVDKTEATLRDQIVLTVSIIADREASHRPELPAIRDFQVLEKGSFPRTEMVKGEIRTSTDFVYLLLPRRAGTFVIGPVRVRDKDEVQQTASIRVRISPSASPATEKPEAFIRQEVDISRPYVNEQVVYKLQFFHKVHVMDVQWDPPSFEGFWVEDLGEESRHDQVVGGEMYVVTELRKALFPLSPGALEIDGSSLTCRLSLRRRAGLGPESLFGNRPFRTYAPDARDAVTQRLHADRIRLEVRPLPESGRPAHFSGLVGVFGIRAEIGHERLRVGDSTTLTVTVAGHGNLWDLAAVAPETLDGFKIYPEKPELALEHRQDDIEGFRVFKQSLVPLSKGSREVPAIELHYFDPAAGSYRVASTRPIRIAVDAPLEAAEDLGHSGARSADARGTAVRQVGKDILPIHTGLPGGGTQILSSGLLRSCMAGFLVPPAAVLTCYGLKVRRTRQEVSRNLARRRGARKRAQERLKQAGRGLDGSGGGRFLWQVSQSLKGFLADRLDVAAFSWTPAEVCACLMSQGVDPNTAGSVRELLEVIEGLEFGAVDQGALERGAMYGLYRKAAEMLERMDRSLRSAGR
ncbi:MAG: BatD family protein [bacterium]